MESLFIVWRFLLLASLFAFPQLLGILLYFRLRRAPRWIAAIAGTLAPAFFFLWLGPILLFAGVREASARGEGCGMPAFGALLLLFAGTTIHLGLGLITQVFLWAKRRQRRSNPASS
jgi:hypothetical protein